MADVVTLYNRMLLWVFALFMIAGNFFRLLPLSFFPSHLSIIEITLYALCLPSFFTRFSRGQILVLIVLASMRYGSFLYGSDQKNLLYGLKLIGMIGAGLVLGRALFDRFGSQQDRALGFLLNIFAAAACASLALLVVFPSADQFFHLLDRAGIHFFGDPHKKRLISVFFDPNYYGAIAAIPLILAYHLKKLLTFVLVFLTLLLTFSRSGIAAGLFLSVPMVFFASKPFPKRVLYWVVAASVLVLSCLILYANELFYFVNRTVHTLQDPSALARFSNFKSALHDFWERPLFGRGYNYLSTQMATDSSLLVTLVSFGLIPTLLIALWGLFLAIRSLSKCAHPILRWLYVYLALCIVFTSQFNNLLYYQYWLIPMLALFTYFEWSAHESCART